MRKALKLKKNKHASVPVTLLVLGVLAVCALAIFSFIKSDSSVKKSFYGIRVMERANMEIEQGNLNYYYDEKTVRKVTPGFNLNWVKEVVVFSVEYGTSFGEFTGGGGGSFGGGGASGTY